VPAGSRGHPGAPCIPAAGEGKGRKPAADARKTAECITAGAMPRAAYSDNPAASRASPRSW
jgi:hypothetical protein